MKPEERARRVFLRSSIRWRFVYHELVLPAVGAERASPERGNRSSTRSTSCSFWNRSSRQSVGTTR